LSVDGATSILGLELQGDTHGLIFAIITGNGSVFNIVTLMKALHCSTQLFKKKLMI
jgi:hypothetical protein